MYVMCLTTLKPLGNTDTLPSPVVQSSSCIALQVFSVGVAACDQGAALRHKQALALAGQGKQLSAAAVVGSNSNSSSEASHHRPQLLPLVTRATCRSRKSGLLRCWLSPYILDTTNLGCLVDALPMAPHPSLSPSPAAQSHLVCQRRRVVRI